ncbi:phosphonopyruvate decarboxylase [Bacteroides cellulosilyticus]|uniref:phosphonopyruvate decarboxylase n=1 Tax=Bacteroides cellulosilyticus TaxID=246787 RepID=UPI00189BF5BA|nr:phosphonopyruvate decarboxylase [Bacteroides cellulosilyticus]
MVDQNKLFEQLNELGLNFFTGVPDSLLNDFCLHLVNNVSDCQHVMVANEGNAIGVAAGYHMATGEIPVVYMQNSGIGNAANPLLSLTHQDVYSIPLILLIGWRGEPGINDHAQHKKQGELTPVLMTDMDIPYEILDVEETIVEKFAWAVKVARESKAPVALIVKKTILTKKEKKQVYPESLLMNREEAISAVLDVFGGDAIYLATTGRATRELHEQITLHGLSHELEFLNVGAMGHLSSIGLGLAIVRPDKKIVVFDGDAAAVMHMGSLATNGRYQPKNMIHIVLNNGVNESVGGQKSSGQIVDLTGVAKACGYETPISFVETKDALQNAVKTLVECDRLSFVDVHICQGIRKDMPKLSIEHQLQKEALMNCLKQ